MLKEESKSIEKIIDQSIQDTVSQYNCVAIALVMNESSYSIYASGGAGKGMDIQFKTEKTGRNAGYILRDNSKALPVGYKFAPSPDLTKDNEDLLFDANNRPVTSDLDLLFLEFLHNGSLYFDKNYGWVRPEDVLWIDSVNKKFKHDVYKTFSVEPGNLCQHGPFSHLKSLGPKCLKFPMKVFIPGQNVQIIYSRIELLSLYLKLQKIGFLLSWPERWGAVDDPL